MSAYYNEIDPKAAAWLRELIRCGHIAAGEVDERSIAAVQPDDLRGFTQCHFFAGIGVWSYALRQAGWADDRPVWTGSCPCQPFSAAGKGDEFADERHLWPAWFRLIRECRPVACFGEQVASKDALAWLDHVSTDLEAEGYAVGAVDTCAAGFGAPHIRQRLYFVAESKLGIRRHVGSAGEQGRVAVVGRSTGLRQDDGEIMRSGNFAASNPCFVADSQQRPTERHGHEMGGEARGMQGAPRQQRIRHDIGNGIVAGELADPDGRDTSTEREQRSGEQRLLAQGGGSSEPLADTTDPRRPGAREHECGQPQLSARPVEHGDMGDAEQPGLQEQRRNAGIPCDETGADVGKTVERASAPVGAMGYTDSTSAARYGSDGGGSEAAERLRTGHGNTGPTNGFWSNAEWIACRDGKARPTEPGTFPLVTGAPARVVRLRGYGNSINAEQAKAFIEAHQDVRAI